jgi:hypothetical protein
MTYNLLILVLEKNIFAKLYPTLFLVLLFHTSLGNVRSLKKVTALLIPKYRVLNTSLCCNFYSAAIWHSCPSVPLLSCYTLVSLEKESEL